MKSVNMFYGDNDFWTADLMIDGQSNSLSVIIDCQVTFTKSVNH